MKKIVLFLFVAIATLSVKAQDLYMGGTVGLWRNDDANTTSFKLAPEIGYNLSEQWALGVELQFNHEYKEHISTNTFAIAPYARFSYYENKIVRLFVDGGFGFATTKVKDGGDAVNGFEIGLKPGIAIKLNQHFSLVAKCGFRDIRTIIWVTVLALAQAVKTLHSDSITNFNQIGFNEIG